MEIWWVLVHVQYDPELECNVAYIKKGDYDIDKLSKVITRLDNDFKLPVVF